MQFQISFDWPDGEKTNELLSYYFSHDVCPSFPLLALGRHGVFQRRSRENRTDDVLFLSVFRVETPFKHGGSCT